MELLITYSGVWHLLAGTCLVVMIITIKYYHLCVCVCVSDCVCFIPHFTLEIRSFDLHNCRSLPGFQVAIVVSQGERAHVNCSIQHETCIIFFSVCYIYLQANKQAPLYFFQLIDWHMYCCTFICRWINSARCVENLPQAFILVHLHVRDAR